jgi:hypothetical protein
VPAPRELVGEFSLTDAWRPMEDQNIISCRIAKLLRDLVDEIVAAEKWQPTTRWDVALEAP